MPLSAQAETAEFRMTRLGVKPSLAKTSSSARASAPAAHRARRNGDKGVEAMRKVASVEARRSQRRKMVSFECGACVCMRAWRSRTAST